MCYLLLLEWMKVRTLKCIIATLFEFRFLWQLIILSSSGLVLVTCPYCLPFDHRWGPAVYIIKPKATPNYYQYSELATNFKYTNCASVFTVQVTCFMFRFSWYHFSWCEPGQVSSIEIHVHCKQQHDKMPLNYSIENHCLKALDATKTLKRAWRVAYQKETNEPWLSSFESKMLFFVLIEISLDPTSRARFYWPESLTVLTLCAHCLLSRVPSDWDLRRSHHASWFSENYQICFATWHLLSISTGLYHQPFHFLKVSLYFSSKMMWTWREDLWSDLFEVQ